MKQVRFVSADEVVLINRVVLEVGTETHFLRDRDTLESSVARPMNVQFYQQTDDPFILSVSLLESIAKKQAFEQGNKRTALRACLTMLKLNGYDLPLTDSEEVAKLVEKLIEGEVEPSLLVAFLKSQTLK